MSKYMVRMPWGIREGCITVMNTCPLDAINFVMFNLKWVTRCDELPDLWNKSSLYYQALTLAKAKKYNESRVLQYKEGMHQFSSVANPTLFLDRLITAWKNPVHGACSLNFIWAC